MVWNNGVPGIPAGNPQHELGDEEDDGGRFILAEDVPDYFVEEIEIVDQRDIVARIYKYVQKAYAEGTDEELDADYGCGICLERKSQLTVLPCMHSKTCYMCALDYVQDYVKDKSTDPERLLRCPYCRTEIVEIVPKMDGGYE